MLIEPRVYAEAQDIAEHLKIDVQQWSIYNESDASREANYRFLSGTVYALGGDIQRIGNDIFLCTPENVKYQEKYRI